MARSVDKAIDGWLSWWDERETFFFLCSTRTKREREKGRVSRFGRVPIRGYREPHFLAVACVWISCPGLWLLSRVPVAGPDTAAVLWLDNTMRVSSTVTVASAITRSFNCQPAI